MTSLKTTTIAAALVAVLLPSASRADSGSIATVGIGTGIGVMSHKAVENDEASSSFVSEMALRARFLYVLGAELDYSMNDGQAADETLQFGSTYRLSALLYPIPTEYVGLYLKAGVGSRELADLTNIGGDTTSYHAGAGLEVYVSDHVALSGEFLWLVPGVHSVKRSIVTQALAAADAYGTSSSSYGAAVVPPEPDSSDYLSIQNFQASVGVKYYF